MYYKTLHSFIGFRLDNSMLVREDMDIIAAMLNRLKSNHNEEMVSRSGSSLLLGSLLVAIMALAGCAGNQQGYQNAFNNQNSLTQNQCTFTQSGDAIFKIVKQTFIQQGFTIESADLKSGIVKAVRNMGDKEDPEISYNIHASADISEVAGTETNISLAASQQTILHRSTTTWWHLLWILPVIPTGTEYQTLVIKEGNITEPSFYTDFFNSVKISVTKYDLALKAAAAKAAEKAEAEAKAAAIKAEAERVAAEKAAKLKAEAEAKAAAEKAEADRIAEEKANAEKQATEKLAAEKIAAEQKAAAVEAARIADEEAAAAARANTQTKKKKRVANN
jgi:hypothetical protein